jgi:hypothetical protein
MLYMIIEDFRDGDAVPVYRRLRDGGRGIPEGLTYIDSWVTQDLSRCFQLMACDDRALLDEWMACWVDLVHFEVVPVFTSTEAAAIVSSRL